MQPQPVPSPEPPASPPSPEDPPAPPYPQAEFTSDCEARIAFDVLANRWDSVVVLTLGAAGTPLRPHALRTRIGGISAKVLNESLRRLERNGLLARHAYAEAPPRVDYALTEAGTALLDPMRAMGAWAKRYGPTVLESQDRFDGGGENSVLSPSHPSRPAHTRLTPSGARPGASCATVPGGSPGSRGR